VKIGTSAPRDGPEHPVHALRGAPEPRALVEVRVAGAHTLLLFLMARTPNGPIIKEFKPRAHRVKKIEHGRS